MYRVLVVVGVLVAAAGLVTIGTATSINMFSRGNIPILAGIAAVGCGLFLVGLVAGRQLRRMVASLLSATVHLAPAGAPAAARPAEGGKAPSIQPMIVEMPDEAPLSPAPATTTLASVPPGSAPPISASLPSQLLTRKNLKLFARYPTRAARAALRDLNEHNFRAAELQSRVRELESRVAEYEIVQSIHLRDMSDIEDLMRMVALPDLPRRSGRDRDLAMLMGTSVCEAFYVIDALHKAHAATEGAVCEFGVAQGATSRLLAEEIRATNRRLYLFDSFEGLPRPSAKDRLLHDMFHLGSMEAYAGTMRLPETLVIGKLSEISFPMDRVMIMKGWADQTLRDPRAPSKVAFAYIDFDLYEPIRDTLLYVDSHSAIGARVVVDDYGFFSEGAQLATDEFIASANGRWVLHKPLPFAGHFVTLEKVSDQGR